MTRGHSRLAAIAGAAVVLSAAIFAQAPEKVVFARDVQPLLRANCRATSR